MNMSLFDRNGTLCESELIRRATLCQECMSEHCILTLRVSDSFLLSLAVRRSLRTKGASTG